MKLLSFKGSGQRREQSWGGEGWGGVAVKNSGVTLSGTLGLRWVSECHARLGFLFMCRWGPNRTQWGWGADREAALLMGSRAMLCSLVLDHPEQQEGTVHPRGCAAQVPRGLGSEAGMRLNGLGVS